MSHSSQSMQTYAVCIPSGIGPGQQFQAQLGGQLTMVIVPRNCAPCATLHVKIPSQRNTSQYAVTIPPGVTPGTSFTVNLANRLVEVTCPMHMHAGGQIIVNVSSKSESESPLRSWPPPLGVPDEIDVRCVSEHFICPITSCIMRQPAVTPGGITYDYDAIAEWLREKRTDPATNELLDISQLYPNRTVRNMIEDYIVSANTNPHDANPL